MTQDKNMGFFTRVITSIKDFDKYQIFATENIPVAIKYLLKIMIIFVVLVVCIYTYKFSITVNNAINYFKEDITQIKYSDGSLQINSDQPTIIDTTGEIIEKIIIDTGANEEKQKEYIDKINSNSTAVIFLKDKIVLKNQMITQSMEYKYADIAKNYLIGNFEKEDVLNAISNVNIVGIYVMFFITMFIYLFIIYITSTLIDVLMLAVLGFLVSRIARMKLRFKATYNMAIYALTLPIILNLIYIIINSLTGITVQYFNWMYTTISYIYIIIAILMIKTDLINKEMELMKIVQEQKKVKEEIQKQKEDQNEEELKKKEDNKKEKENEEADDSNKDNNLGDNNLAPQG